MKELTNEQKFMKDQQQTRWQRVLTNEQKFMKDQTVAFQDFVLDSMDDGIHEDFEDHFAFLAACMETFIDMNADD